MYSKDDYVYCAPDMRHGTIDQIRGDRFYVEWDEPDMNEDAGAWYYEDELEKPKRRKPSKAMRRIYNKKITSRTLKYMGVKINNNPVLEEQDIAFFGLRVKNVGVYANTYFKKWSDENKFNEWYKALAEQDSSIKTEYDNAMSALQAYQESMKALGNKIQVIGINIAKNRKPRVTNYGRD